MNTAFSRFSKVLLPMFLVATLSAQAAPPYLFSDFLKVCKDKATEILTSKTLRAALGEKQPAIPATFLTPIEKPVSHSTVTVEGINSRGQVVVVKEAHAPWNSSHNHSKVENTPQGDPRKVIFFVGTQVASKMAFAIRSRADGKVELLAPGTRLVLHFIQQMNPILVSSGHDPVTFLPIRAGLVRSEDLLDFSLSVSNEFQVAFPYDDAFPELIAHEISDHLGPIALSKKILGRTRAVNLETDTFTDYLETRTNLPKDLVQKVVTAMKLQRGAEVEMGLGSLVSELAGMRSRSNLSRYDHLKVLLDHRPNAFTRKHFENDPNYFQEKILDRIAYLCRPTLQPIEAVLMHLHILTGLPISLPGHQTLPEYPWSKGFISLKLSESEIKALQLAVETYTDLHAKATAFTQPFAVESEKEVFSEILETLDKRLEEISNALDRI